MMKISRRNLLAGFAAVAAAGIARSSSYTFTGVDMGAGDDRTIITLSINGQNAREIVIVEGSMDGKKWFPIPHHADRVAAANLKPGRYYRMKWA